MEKITKDMTIGEVLDNDIETVPFFMDLGMHCLGCPASRMESIEDACLVHGIDPDKFLESLNEFLASRA